MIRRLLGAPLDWRFNAVIARLDSLAARAEHEGARLEELDGRVTHLTATLESLHERTTQLAEDAAAGRTALDERVQPLLRRIVDEEAANRRRLHSLRASPAYEEAYTDPDPLVTITVPTRGRQELLLERSLPSLLGQTHANLEVLVVGDAAAPELEQAVRALADPRVHYANLSQRISAHPDPRRHWLVGSTMARNEAARRATGRWLLHFDDDDHLRPDTIASLLRTVREHHAEVAYGGFEEHHPDGKLSTGLGFPPRLGCFSWAGALVHGGLRFFERELVAADLELPGDMYMLERMLRVGVRFAMLDEVVLDYYPSTLWEQADTPAAAPSQATRVRFVNDFLGPEHDTPTEIAGTAPSRSYVVCSTPRCGSGLLFRGLAGSGKLGVPLEYFNPLTRVPLAERWQCGTGLDSYVEALHTNRCTPTGLFGSKLHWDQLPRLRAEAGLGSDDALDYKTADSLLERLFPEPRFIRIVRLDLDSQAVSYWRALHSNVWSIEASADRPPQDTPYSFEGIDRCRRVLENGELCWERLIRARGEKALVISYEELTESYEQTLMRVADYVSPGVDVTIPTPKTGRMSDEHSQELLERYRADRAERS